MRILTAMFVVVSLCSVSLAQQPNTATASLTIDNQGGPPYPIANATVFTGVNASFDLLGQPATPYWVATAPTLSAGELSTTFGILDLPLSNLNYLWQGQDILDGFGNKNFTIAVPQNISLSTVACYQAGVVDSAAPAGATFTAATRISMVRGIVSGTLNIPDDGTATVSLSPYNLQAAYYGSRYSTLFVNCNGSVSYNAGNGDFTATSGEFLSQQARAAFFWTDLNTAAGGSSVTWNIDWTSGIPTFLIDFSNVGESFGPTTRHWISMTHQLHTTGDVAPPGDIVMIHPATNPQSNFDTIVGITPGANQGNTSSVDLSVTQGQGGLVGNPNDSIFEFFSGQTSTTGIPGPPYDLQNRNLTFFGVNVGNSGASYIFF